MTQELEQVWRPGRNGGIEFANIKLLEKQEPTVYKLMEWKEGFETNDFHYHYKVGKHFKFGLWLSRKPVNTEDLQAVATSVTANENKPTENLSNGHIDVDKPSLNVEEIKILKSFCAMANRFQ